MNKKKIIGRFHSYFAWRTALELGIDFFKLDWNKEMRDNKKLRRLVIYNIKKGKGISWHRCYLY